MKRNIAAVKSMPPGPQRSEVRDGPVDDLSWVPHARVVVRVGVVGQGVGVRAALERHGAPHGRRRHPPKDASSDLRRVRAAPDRPPTAAIVLAATSYTTKGPHTPRPDEALGV